MHRVCCKSNLEHCQVSVSLLSLQNSSFAHGPPGQRSSSGIGKCCAIGYPIPPKKYQSPIIKCTIYTIGIQQTSELHFFVAFSPVPHSTSFPAIDTLRAYPISHIASQSAHVFGLQHSSVVQFPLRGSFCCALRTWDPSQGDVLMM